MAKSKIEAITASGPQVSIDELITHLEGLKKRFGGYCGVKIDRGQFDDIEGNLKPFKTQYYGSDAKSVKYIVLK